MLLAGGYGGCRRSGGRGLAGRIHDLHRLVRLHHVQPVPVLLHVEAGSEVLLRCELRPVDGGDEQDDEGDETQGAPDDADDEAPVHLPRVVGAYLNAEYYHAGHVGEGCGWSSQDFKRMKSYTWPIKTQVST